MKSDLIMRLIEQIAQALAQVSGLVKSGQVGEAQERLDQAFSSILGISRPLAEQLTAESLRISLDKKPGAPQLLDAARQLLLAQADVYEATGSPNAARLRATAQELSLPEA